MTVGKRKQSKLRAARSRGESRGSAALSLPKNSTDCWTGWRTCSGSTMSFRSSRILPRPQGKNASSLTDAFPFTCSFVFMQPPHGSNTSWARLRIASQQLRNSTYLVMKRTELTSGHVIHTPWPVQGGHSLDVAPYARRWLPSVDREAASAGH